MIARLALGFLLLYASLARGQDVRGTSLPEARRLAHPPGVALVLSGGGIKGFAHIGVLEVLDSAHVPIGLIAGTSIGAVVGGLYAAGYTPKQLEHFAESVHWGDVLGLQGESNRSERSLNQKDMDHALLSLRFTGFFNPVIPQAISNGERLTMLLNEMVLNAPAGVPRDFLRDLRVPFVAVTTDIVHGTRQLLTKGDLTEALRASATLPLRFSPVPGDSEILMDGGLLANIPADVAREFGASRVIVSNATAGLHPREALNTPWDVADQVITLMMLRQNAKELKLSDCTITPNVSDLDENDYSNIPAMIEAGREAARAMLPKIEGELASLKDPPVAPSAQDTLLPALGELRIVGTKGEYVDSAILTDRSLLGWPLVRSGTMKTIEQRVLRDYRSRGYSLVRIDSVVLRPRIDRADLYLDEGHIARIAVHGGENTDTDFVLRELSFNRGDIFHARAGEQSLQNLTGTGLFDFAILQISYDSLWPGTRYIETTDTFASGESPQTMHPPSLGPMVILTVHSESPNVLRLGALADNEFGAEFSAELANENISGTGMEYSLLGSLGSLARSASLDFSAPRLFHGFGILDARIYSGYRDINVYSLLTNPSEGRITSSITDVVREERDLGVRLRAGGQVERLGAITVEMRAEHQRWMSTSAGASPATAGDDQLRTLRAQLLIDSRDDADYPHEGTLVRGYAETGLSLFGQGTNYTKFFGEVEQAIPISALHTLVPRLRIGFGDAFLPRLEEFALGGMGSFYGLNEYELRGKQMIETSLRYQIAIPHALYFPTFVAARYDLGAMWPEPAEIKFESLLHGIGAQVGVKTPLGLAQFGMGENFRFVKVPGSNPLSRPTHILAVNSPHFYFSIGSKL
ncbi:MAG TPA: patatin-like phospholipase family protein [Candidatus Kapabacteria bacterium]|nr:patatin-like phospholipase family protein [Candidatus Kapabacteria bacterium]